MLSHDSIGKYILNTLRYITKTKKLGSRRTSRRRCRCCQRHLTSTSGQPLLTSTTNNSCIPRLLLRLCRQRISQHLTYCWGCRADAGVRSDRTDAMTRARCFQTPPRQLRLQQQPWACPSSYVSTSCVGSGTTPLPAWKRNNEFLITWSQGYIFVFKKRKNIRVVLLVLYLICTCHDLRNVEALRCAYILIGVKLTDGLDHSNINRWPSVNAQTTCLKIWWGRCLNRFFLWKMFKKSNQTIRFCYSINPQHALREYETGDGVQIHVNLVGYNVNGHTTLKAPVLIWTPKLSSVGPS